MGKIIKVKVEKLEFWLNNYRFGKAKDQKDAQEKLAKTRNFNDLVKSIKKLGFQCNNLLTVSENREKRGFYLVYDGNRRLAAVKNCPQIDTLQVYEENDEEALNDIIDREHTTSKAGRLKWTSVQQARRENDKYRQRLLAVMPNNVKCLKLLEEVLGDELPDDFHLSTFERLYSEEFIKRFGIVFNPDPANSDPVKVRKKDEISEIIKDITDKHINSRNINTEDNIRVYLDRLLDGKSQDVRTQLSTDIDDNGEIDVEEEEINPTRLFSPSLFEELEEYIDNKKFMDELEKASIARYPNLLTLATRAVLDTLVNIDKKNQENPSSMAPEDCKKYLDHKKNLIKHAQALINGLGKHAHDMNNLSSPDVHKNNRELLNSLIVGICRSIDEGRKS